MKKLSLGVQDFAAFKTNNLIYVDKTELIYRLIDDGSYYFLSRPRRLIPAGQYHTGAVFR